MVEILTWFLMANIIILILAIWIYKLHNRIIKIEENLTSLTKLCLCIVQGKKIEFVELEEDED